MQVTRSLSVLLNGLLGASLLGGCVFIHTDGVDWGDSLRGSGHRAEVRRALPEFHAVDMAAAGTLRVHLGGSPSAVVSGDDDLIGYVRTDVRDGVLRVRVDRDCTFRAGLRVDLTAPELDSLSMNGVGSVEVTGVRTEELDLTLRGAGSVRARGTVQRLTADLGGTGQFHLLDLAARAATVTLRGTGGMEIRASDALHYDISGVGTISYLGDPVLSGSVSGVGGLRRLP